MKKKNRTAVVINYVSLLFILIIFYTIRELDVNKWYLLIEIIPLVVMRISFNTAYHKSGLWIMIHKSQKTLDEREIQILHRAIRMSYNIYVILVLLLIMIFAVVDLRPIDMVLVVCLGYVSHTLPAAVI
ncbi:MAG: hypothetical protein U9P73_03025, partial [Candidatus Cloacimonadota bacterium]|nr:hypothetical protein [Candidatus Cloacimonadota bacterium]